MTAAEQIKLAKAMGWKWVFGSGANGYWVAPGGMKTDWIVVDDRHALLPDPETDANADYAVLVWFGDQEDSQQRENFLEVVYDIRLAEYKIGDIARAALRELS